MDTTLLTPLASLETSLTTLLTSLTQTNTYTAAPSATRSLLSADDALSSALVTLRTHQENYTRILTLRAEATRLQTELKSIVRTAVDLRTSIGTIHPSILDSSSDEDEDEKDTSTNPVEYTTLLSFAARIGKHNATAAVEAERQSNSRPVPTVSNGTTTTTAAAGGNPTEESLTELAAINDTLAAQRAYRGMAFPAAESLRMGLLGRLQFIREQEGEEGVDREVERLVLEGERGRVVGSDVAVKGREGGETEQRQEEKQQRQSQSQSAGAPSVSVPSLPPKPPPKKIALDLDLDFGDSDDDDE